MNAPHLNLQWVRALIVDPDGHSAKLFSRMLEGAGLKKQQIVDSYDGAVQYLKVEQPDLIFCESKIGDTTCADFILGIRKLDNKALRTVPILVFTGYTERKTVEIARDSGVNFVLKKPIDAAALYDRLAWIAKGNRDFVEAAPYTGPDRRYKNSGLPNGVGHRTTDLAGEVGTQVDTNMSQDEIDSLIKPMKIDL